jgi:hypothetical protein
MKKEEISVYLAKEKCMKLKVLPMKILRSETRNLTETTKARL